MTGKEIYERRKKLKADRMLREEDARAGHRQDVDEGEILIASLAASFERIADALETMAQNKEAQDDDS